MTHRERTAMGRAGWQLSGRLAVRSGFTLYELLMVTVIAGIVMSIAATRVDWMSMQVTSAGRQVMTTLLAAQRLAILRQHAVVVSFDETNSRLRIHEDRNNNGKVDAGENVKYMPLEEATTFGRGAAPARPFGSTTFSFVKRQDDMPALAFYRTGNASEQGGFYITSRRASGSSSRYARDTKAVEVSRATGRLSYMTYDGTSWRRGF